MAQVAIIILATLLHGIFLCKAKPLQSANDRSRWCTVLSLIERGTFQIDEIRKRPGWDTIDLVHVDGHYYSTKPPLLTTIVAGMTWCVQKSTGWSLQNQTQSVTVSVLLMMNLIPFAVSLVAWMAILELCSIRFWTRIFAVAIASFGTLVTPFLMTLNNHTIAAASTMIAIFAMLRILKESDTSLKRWPFVLCGFAAAWAAANELPAASLGAFLFVLAGRRSIRKTLMFFLPAAAIPLIALIAMNYVATGSWKPVYADYGSSKYRFVIDGVPSYWMHPQGVDRNLDSPWNYFLHCTVGHHGIFSLTPISLLALVGWLYRFRHSDRAHRVLLWVGGVTSAVVIAFYMTRTQNYNYGGVSCGLRWAVWLTPLWLLAIVPVLDAWSNSRLARVFAILLSTVSIYSAWQPIDNPWHQPWLFQSMESRGWIDYSEDRPTLPRPLWSWFASLPQPIVDDSAWIEFTVAQPGLSSRIVRLTARPDAKGPIGERLDLEFRETSSDGSVAGRVRTMSIDVREFQAGAPPADFLSWSDSSTTSEQKQSDLAFVRGLPRKIPFEARVIRYLKTPLRPEAFRCKLTVGQVAFSAKEGDPPMTYRCDTWLTDDVPFGVAQVEFRITQPETAAIVFQERWTVRDCWPKASPFVPEIVGDQVR